uniref:RRM domain-containing protein n=1 Tax=Panagrolaimus sp. ES5 TaxID=591445 RepID=A0AC34F4D1_9BILA
MTSGFSFQSQRPANLEQTFPHKRPFSNNRLTPFNRPFAPNRPFSNEPRSGIKAWRLIIRGLDDFTKREELEEYFGKCGTLKEIVLPKSKIRDNANAPFGFVQYASKLDAERAIKVLNNEPFKGRKLKVEIAVDKDTYITKQQEAKEVASKKAKLDFNVNSEEDESNANEEENDVDDEIEEEKVLKHPLKKQNSTKKVAQKGPLPEFEDLIESSDSEDEDMESEDEDETEVDDEDDSDPEEDSIKEEEQSDEEEDKEDSGQKTFAKPSKDKKDKPRKTDTAMEEGRVILLRNLSYEVTDESLKEAMEEFGEVTLAILCTFKDSGHPTGTAFVHFKDKENADKVLEALESENGLLIEGRKVFGYRAVSKEKAGDFKKPDKTPSDNRNLYLLRVSLIRPGTAQANDMSEEDAAKRAALLSLTKQKLKNLHMFVSPTRLSIHNVPFTMTEKELLQVCKEAAKNPKAYITECRIMRKKLANNVGGKIKLGASKGFAFVEFKTHEDALACLKKLNNNPHIFKKERRPIVEFSIENRAALRLREQRVTKNQQKEPQKKLNQAALEKMANEAALEKTKKVMMKGGAKPLPKKFFTKGKGAKKTKGKKKLSKKGNKKVAQNMTVNWNLLNEIAGFNPNDPDIDQAFIDALMLYYFPPTVEVLEKLLEEIEKKPKGVDILIALGLRLSRERIKTTRRIGTFVNEIIKAYGLNQSEKTSTTKELYFIFLCDVLDFGLLGNEIDYYLDMSLSQLQNKNANLFCRKEVEHFVAKILYSTPNSQYIQRLITSTTECSTMMALDGLSKIYFDAKLIDTVVMQKENVLKLLNHLKNIERAERNVCKLAAHLIWKCEIGLDIFSEFPNPYTKLNTVNELMNLVSNSPNFARKRATFELLKREAGNEIDYILPFITDVLNEKEIPSLLMSLRSDLPYPRHCSPEALHQFFSLANTYLPIDVFPLLLDLILPRIRRSPHEILCSSMIKSPGAKTFFTKIISSLIQTNDLTDFDVALDIIAFYQENNDPILIPGLDFKTKVLEKIFQDEDLFLAKNSANYLSKNNPAFLTENAKAIFKARTDRDVRISVINGIINCFDVCCSPSAYTVAKDIVCFIYENDDDAEVREAALTLCKRISTFPELSMIIQIFTLSVTEWKSRQSQCTVFYGDTKAQLDDLISTMKSKTHNCNECISKECY